MSSMAESWVQRHNRATPFGWYCKIRRAAKATGIPMEFHSTCPLVPRWWNFPVRWKHRAMF